MAMEIFQLVKTHLAILGLIQSHPSLNRKLFRASFVVSLNLILSCSYFFFVASSFEEYINSFFTSSGSVGIFVIFFIYVWKIKKLYELIGKLQETVNARLQNPELKAIYDQTNQQVEILSRISYFFFAKFTPACLCLPNFIVSFFNYFATDLRNDAFVLPIPMWFPFEWNSPIRYLIVSVLQYITGTIVLIPISWVASIGIGNLLWMISIKNDIICELNSISTNTKSKKTRVHISKQLAEFIEMHTNAKQIVNGHNVIFQPISLLINMWSLVCISSAMLVVQWEITHHSSNPVILIALIISIIYQFGAVFVVCEVGERFSNLFIEIDDVLENLKWYLFPIDVRHVLPIVIVNVQETIVVECFGSFSCCRDSFKKVVKSAFSYFMVLRELYE